MQTTLRTSECAVLSTSHKAGHYAGIRGVWRRSLEGSVHCGSAECVLTPEGMMATLPPEILRLVPGYLENRKKDLLTLQSALQSKDFETIKFIGHNIKGNAESYGFPTLTPLGKRLEKAALASDADELESCLEELAEFLDSVSC